MFWKEMEGAIWEKLQQKLCKKDNFAVHNWIKVKLLYYCNIKAAFQCFLQLGDMSFSSWDIFFFVRSGLKGSKAVSVGQISDIFEMKQMWQNYYSSQRVFIPPPFQIISPPFKKIFNPPLPNDILPNPECSYTDCFG